MVKISIIIPVYNAEKYLNMTLDAVMQQTFADFEAVCIDDGSTDRSYEILQEYAAKDKRFKIYHQENQGGSISRNNGLSYAKGEYIAFLDNDDIYHPQYLEILYNNIIKYEADVSTCSYLKFASWGNYTFENKIVNSPIDFVSTTPFIDKFKKKRKIEMLMWTKLYKKELLDNIRFSPALPAINDVLFNIEVLLAAKKVVVSKEKLIAYRLIETSQTLQPLSVKRLEEYKNMAIEIHNLTKNFSRYKCMLEKIISNYLYGLYCKETTSKYKICRKKNKQLYDKIIADIMWLENEKILRSNRLSLIKRIKLYLFKKSV